MFNRTYAYYDLAGEAYFKYLSLCGDKVILLKAEPFFVTGNVPHIYHSHTRILSNATSTAKSDVLPFRFRFNYYNIQLMSSILSLCIQARVRRHTHKKLICIFFLSSFFLSSQPPGQFLQVFGCFISPSTIQWNYRYTSICIYRFD